MQYYIISCAKTRRLTKLHDASQKSAHWHIKRYCWTEKVAPKHSKYGDQAKFVSWEGVCKCCIFILKIKFYVPVL